MIRPRGGSHVYLCTVCAVVTRSTDGGGVTMGIDILDSWESTSASKGVPLEGMLLDLRAV